MALPLSIALCVGGVAQTRSRRRVLHQERMSIVTRHGPFVVVLVVAIAFNGGLNRAESSGGSGIKGLHL